MRTGSWIAQMETARVLFIARPKLAEMVSWKVERPVKVFNLGERIVPILALKEGNWGAKPIVPLM